MSNRQRTLRGIDKGIRSLDAVSRMPATRMSRADKRAVEQTIGQLYDVRKRVETWTSSTAPVPRGTWTDPGGPSGPYTWSRSASRTQRVTQAPPRMESTVRQSTQRQGRAGTDTGTQQSQTTRPTQTADRVQTTQKGETSQQAQAIRTTQETKKAQVLQQPQATVQQIPSITLPIRHQHNEWSTGTIANQTESTVVEEDLDLYDEIEGTLAETLEVIEHHPNQLEELENLASLLELEPLDVDKAEPSGSQEIELKSVEVQSHPGDISIDEDSQADLFDELGLSELARPEELDDARLPSLKDLQHEDQQSLGLD